MARTTIILAHGILGFGNFTGLRMPLNYFNGVAAHLERQGYNVIAPQVNPIKIAVRGKQLAAQIPKRSPKTEKVHVLAHSMGGLDARYALANYPELVEVITTLVTIGTPHRGSPVADAIANPTDRLFEYIPPFLRKQLESNAGGLRDLTTEKCIEFNKTTSDVQGVRYIAVAGDASKDGHELFLYRLAAAIGNLKGEVNDGVVTRSSALRDGYEQLADWPTDHAGEIGWSLSSPLPAEIVLPFVPPPRHLAWYDAIVKTL